jgi:DNA-binding transcriptional LysR family regulator
VDTEQLRTFLEVSRTRHFGRAAQNLFLSQSAVSSRVQNLEEQVGTPLFIRDRNNIRLTPAGHRLLAHAEDILSAWNRAKHDVAVESDDARSLAFAGTPSLWDIKLQKWLQELHLQQPNTAIFAEVCDSDVLLRRIMEGTLDLGFTFDSPQLPKIEVRQIADVSLVMVSSRPGLTLDEAFGNDYVFVDWGMSFAIEHARYFPGPTLSGTRLPLGRIARKYLLECGGTAYLAKSTIKKSLLEKRLYLVEGAPVIQRPTYAVFSKGSAREELITEALEYLV